MQDASNTHNVVSYISIKLEVRWFVIITALHVPEMPVFGSRSRRPHQFLHARLSWARLPFFVTAETSLWCVGSRPSFAVRGWAQSCLSVWNVNCAAPMAPCCTLKEIQSRGEEEAGGRWWWNSQRKGLFLGAAGSGPGLLCRRDAEVCTPGHHGCRKTVGSYSLHL